MAEPPPTVAEEFVMALAVALYRNGALSAPDLAAAADELRQRARVVAADEAARLNAAACLADSVIVEAEAPPASEWRADEARSRFRVIEGDA